MKKRGLNLPKAREITAPASLLKRFASYFIDFFIINIIIIGPFKKIVEHILPKDASASELYSYMQQSNEANVIIAAISVIIGILAVSYFTYFEYRTQQTPGKMLMKNFIVPEKGKKLTFWNYLLSNLTFVPFFPFILLWIIDPIHMFISQKNQRFMEKIANIVVMEKYKVI